MRPRNAIAVCSAVLILLCSAFPAAAARRLTTRTNSDYGSGIGSQSNWLLSGPSTTTANGVQVTAATICPSPDGGIDQQTLLCTGRWVFLYQIPSGPTNLVLTFSGLTKFAFDAAGTNPALGGPTFGVLICSTDPTAPATNMPCTNLTSTAVQGLNLGFEVESGNLTVTVPSFPPAAAALTFFIAENVSNSGPVELPNALNPPVLTVGGAILSPAAVTFGSQEAGTASSPQTMTYTNSGDFATALNFSNITASTNFTTSGTCASVEPGANCVFFLSFAPTAAGSVNGTFSVIDNSPSGSEAASLNGQASTPGITLAPPTLSFGSQQLGTSSGAQAVTISNAPTNPQALKIISILSPLDPLSGQADFAEQDNCVGNSIPPGGSCQVSITFAPTIAGSIASTVVLTDNSSDGSHTIAVSGTANEAGTLSTSVSSLSFGSQPIGAASASQSVSLSTSATSAIHLVATNVTGGFILQNDGCGVAAAISSAMPCTESVSFVPTQIGQYTGSLTIAADATGATVVVPLSGNGVPGTPVVSVVPSLSTITTADALMVAVNVSATPTPTGSVVLSSGGYTSSAQTVTGGSASVTVPAGSLPIGTDTLTATFTPDSNSSSIYKTASGTNTVVVTAAPNPSFALTNSGNIAVSPGATTGNSASITVTPSGGFTGSVTLTAALTSTPTGAQDLPTLSFGASNSVNITSTSAGSATLTVSTTAPTSAALSPLYRPGILGYMAGAATASCLFLFVLPVRRRNWARQFGLLIVLLFLSGGPVSCGGGGHNPRKGNSGTTSGPYTITVTGASGSMAQTSTLTLTVN